MVGVATNLTIEYGRNTAVTSAKSSSVDAAYSDPDLLIREYFLSSSTQRAISRKNIIKHIKTVASVFAILGWGASGKARDGYDGSVNLLAETGNFHLLKAVSLSAKEAYEQIIRNTGKEVFAENFLEILIKAIACAYQINANQRFRLLIDVVPQTDRRVVKASIIDALLMIADEMDVHSVREAIKNFVVDQDLYIRDYATEALQSID